jgi:hypothetical protein
LLPEAPKRSIAKLRALHLPEQKKSIINMIWPLLPVSDQPIIMISPSGLLLAVSHLN